MIGFNHFYTNKSGHKNACIASFIRSFNMCEGGAAASQGTANLEENFNKISSELMKNVNMVSVNYNYRNNVTVYNMIVKDGVKLPYYILMFSGTKFEYTYEGKTYNAEYRIYTSKESYLEETASFYKLPLTQRVNYWFNLP